MKLVSELFEEVGKAKSIAEKIDLLRKGSKSLPVEILIQGAYHPNIEFVFSPTELPDYKPDDVPKGMGYTDIPKELDRLYLFVKGSRKVDPNLSIQRRREILIQMLEAMEKNEAEVFLSMFKKDLSVYGITRRIASEAFPQLLPPLPPETVNETIIIRT